MKDHQTSSSQPVELGQGEYVRGIPRDGFIEELAGEAYAKHMTMREQVDSVSPAQLSAMLALAQENNGKPMEDPHKPGRLTRMWEGMDDERGRNALLDPWILLTLALVIIATMAGLVALMLRAGGSL